MAVFKSIIFNGQELYALTDSILSEAKIAIGDPFDKDSKDVFFIPLLEKVCYSVFDAIKEIKDPNQAAMLSSNFFEFLHHVGKSYYLRVEMYWGYHTGLGFFLFVDNGRIPINPRRYIRTPYYLLAENYLLLLGSISMAYGEVFRDQAISSSF